MVPKDGEDVSVAGAANPVMPARAAASVRLIVFPRAAAFAMTPAMASASSAVRPGDMDEISPDRDREACASSDCGPGASASVEVLAKPAAAAAAPMAAPASPVKPGSPPISPETPE